MGMKEDIMKAKKELEEIRNDSFAGEILKDYKKQNKRLFIIWVITFIALIGVTCYAVYLSNDIGTITTDETIDINEVDNIEDSDIQLGDR